VKDKIELTEEMVNTLENPPKANNAFKEAAKKYKGGSVKVEDLSLWIDNGGYKTLDRFTKKELSNYHASDVKDLKRLVANREQQIAELRAALKELSGCSSVINSDICVGIINKALEENQ